METRYLLTLKAILETGSFQNAAKKLGYTQSTISFQMRQLEQEFSVTLFEKIGRRMALTPAGQHIMPQIDFILDTIRQIEDYGQSQCGLAGSLNIMLPESWLLYPMQSVLKDFKRLAPDVHLSMQTLNNNAAGIQHILSGHTDVAFLYGDDVDTSAVATQHLAFFSALLVGSTEQVAKLRPIDQATPDDLKLLVSNDPKCLFRCRVLKAVQKKGVAVDNLITLGSSEAIKKCVVNGLGVAYLPHFVLEQELRQGLVVPLSPSFHEDNISAYCAFRNNRPATPALDLLISLTNNALAQSSLFTP